MYEGTALCEVLYVVLSPMDDYEAQGHPQIKQGKAFEDVA